MFSVKFPKESIYYEIKKDLQKNAREKPSNSIIINYTNNTPINFTKISTINNYQTLNSAKNSNKYRSQIMITKSNKRIKDSNNSIKDKLSIEESNIENNYYHIKNLSPIFNLSESMKAKTLSDKMDYNSFYYNDNNSILKQKILKKLNEQKKQKLNSPQNIPKNNYYYYINKKNNLLKTVQNNFLRRSPFYIKLKRDFNKYNNYSLSPVGIEKNEDNKSYTERISKNYNFFESGKRHELFRNFEDLEKKSIEISKRKMMNEYNSNKYFFSVKKDNNLKEIKQSLDDIREKLFYKEEKNKINDESSSRNKYINKTINNQNSIKALYHISKIKTKINKDNQNNSFKKIKKIFITKKEKRKVNQSPYVKKNYIEDNNSLNILATPINNHRHNAYFHTQNKNKKIKKNILPSISEENDKIKINLNNLVYILKKIIANKKIKLISDFLRKIEKHNKNNKKNINIVYNGTKKSTNLKYSKKIVQKNMNKNMKIYNNKNSNIIKLLSNGKPSNNKFSIFKDFGKVKKLINNLRINLIGFSLKDKYHS